MAEAQRTPATTGRGAKRDYNLTSMFSLRSRPCPHCEAVIKVEGIKTIPQSPGLYVRPKLSGTELSKTEVIQNLTLAWDHTCTM